ncbi:MAG: M20/M25/M40 family metallo-hydrolase [Streptosporangiales bacterium]|nr:M20/M25/M40 family metallo-hydrolase [Streptosporangiales bacterium]
MTPSIDETRAAISKVMPEVRTALEDLVRIPSVSADPQAADKVLASAGFAAVMYRDAGAAEVEILQVDGGQPAVVASWPAPAGAPTVLLYAHHDVQPVGDRSAWASEPFEPVERDGRLYGRGTADDKAGAAAHLAVLKAFEGRPPVGVTVFLEGEEELGSPTIGAFLEKYRERLAADVIVLADSASWAVGVPALTTSLRGVAECYVEVRTLDSAVHSGMWGGAVPDALTALCKLLGTLHDEAGEVAVAGLASGESDPLDLTEERVRSDAGTVEGVELLGGGALTSRMWTKPAVSVLAIDAPRIADAVNILVPVAKAKVSLRVAPGDDADRAREALCRHLEEHAPWGVQVTAAPGESGQPFAVDSAGATHQLAKQAFGAAWDHPVVDIGIGGSIPFVAAFAETFPEADILVTAVADPDSGAHGTNESLHLGEFERYCVGEALLLNELARTTTGG